MPVPLRIAWFALIAVAVVMGIIVGVVRRRRRAGSRPPAAEPSPEVVERLRVLLAGGKKIQAIKALREDTGMGLADAKDYVERLHAGGAR